MPRILKINFEKQMWQSLIAMVKIGMAKNKMAVEKWKLVQKENGLLGQNVRFKGAKKFFFFF